MGARSTRSGSSELALVTGGSLGGMVALEVALERPAAVRHVVPIAAPAAIGPLAIAWNHLQLQLIERLGLDGLSLARQLAMTTYRSEADFDERFGGALEADGRPSIVSYLDHQGRQARRPVRPRHVPDPGRARWTATTSGAAEAACAGRSAGSPRQDVALTGIGIQDDILYGPRQVRALVDAAAEVGVRAGYREIRSTKGHDAFLVEWAQLTDLLREALAG